MNQFVNGFILAEKKLNMLSNGEKSTSNSSLSTFSRNLTNVESTRKCSSTEISLSFTTSTHSSSNEIETSLFISPKEFAEFISKTSVPIIDCRSQMDYGYEHIRSSYNVNCRAKLMMKKLASKCLEDIEPNLSAALTHADTVILYDQSTDVQGEEKVRSPPINLVVQAAKKSNKKVHIIQGGFDVIKSQYPSLIQPTTQISKEICEEDQLPATPDTMDKENFTMTEILPHIYVGNILDAQNLDRLKQYGITHIINSTPDLPLFWEKYYKYLRVDVLDLPSQNIRKYFDTAFQFIDEALHTKTNNILVHCSAGISRSPTLVLAFMIKKYHMKLDEAFQKMRQLRQIVDPNISFIFQLRDWERKCLTNTIPLESNEEKTCNHPRSTSNTYCGTTSKSKSDTKPQADSAIIVN